MSSTERKIHNVQYLYYQSKKNYENKLIKECTTEARKEQIKQNKPEEGINKGQIKIKQRKKSRGELKSTNQQYIKK